MNTASSIPAWLFDDAAASGPAQPETSASRRLCRVGLVVVALVIALTAVLWGGVAGLRDWVSDPPEPQATAQELVGEWRGADGARLVLHADQTCGMTELPVQLDDIDFPDPAGPWSHPWTGAGKWSLEPRSTYTSQNIRIDRGSLFPLYVSKDDRAVRLYFWIGDINKDRRYWLDKV
ncbi:hypothetical protein [Couchioplanes caeruleus]|uniref:Uncharacterized protein n=2 Tax=Couchioplanes caeruleus TaxID=56438 RepID=A0A1K0FGV8_9ACTN|nr:hypothetical protein [Couchioplanes caeruleus]OJF12079.1 hypothetical protein BG844_22570 [Couchioplanes caeruleus subsp. caeruleus]ROP28287.1 hypothetical protein EDD30_1028 [Couchioplanes caeruleus]